jgi:hypothetical protein
MSSWDFFFVWIGLFPVWDKGHVFGINDALFQKVALFSITFGKLAAFPAIEFLS